ncbi:ATP-binding cassette domain-containing protein [Leucobacter sp. UT-8R-CII-1-4]|uniref:ABC transporter ATP-binding protein n=1 Tax=Leucobacter sp. UT-8R-CII-1-4 TaxID=3040075 RepID=UPI0024A839F1|nr:ATP-binding cassette domain-containing protein [Leucobacter sp. UT-8R-CII-1-4]MDI6023675.1 ATP-binding cassette domain-containing protein [Leucobacter sp. UT-8R-CII-1-4]
MTEILRGEHLRREYRIPGQRSPLVAVDDVSLSVSSGEIVGLVGESGSGKSTVSRMLVGIEQLTSGDLYFDGKPVRSRGDFRTLREDVQYVFQDPYGSLAPHLTVRQTVGDSLDLRGLGTPKERDDRVAQVLEEVGLRAADAKSYPAVFSGGQRQRISLARALIMQPRLIICDEITSGLDVSVQAQILNLLLELRDRLDVAYIFVSHDLRVVKYLSDRIIVMKQGQIVEEGAVEQIFAAPNAEYTRDLIAAVPHFDPTRGSTAAL